MTDTTIATVDSAGSALRPPVRPLRLVIPGGEGHLGRLLARYFFALGHAVTTLTRRNSSSPAICKSLAGSSRPWKTVVWDGAHLGPWAQALEHADVLINLAGRSVDCRYNAKNREEILRSRVASTTVLGSAMQSLRHPPRLWLNASTATIYRHCYDRDMDEILGDFGGNEPDAPASWRFSIQVAQQWEQSFFASSTPAMRKIAMRAAMVMSPDPGGVFEVVLRLVRMGLGGPWGSGRQYMSWIHEVDFVRVVEFLIDREEISGVVNLAAPSPLPNSQFLSVLRDAWGIPFGLPAQEWMLELGAFFLRTETELLLKSRRVVPGLLKKHGFEFLFPTWPEAARDLIQQWRKQNARAAAQGFVRSSQEGTRERAA